MCILVHTLIELVVFWISLVVFLTLFVVIMLLCQLSILLISILALVEFITIIFVLTILLLLRIDLVLRLDIPRIFIVCIWTIPIIRHILSLKLIILIILLIILLLLLPSWLLLRLLNKLLHFLRLVSRNRIKVLNSRKIHIPTFLECFLFGLIKLLSLIIAISINCFDIRK